MFPSRTSLKIRNSVASAVKPAPTRKDPIGANSPTPPDLVATSVEKNRAVIALGDVIDSLCTEDFVTDNISRIQYGVFLFSNIFSLNSLDCEARAIP
mmetsp:Transcript_20578/g.42842  ORF Transcript_20578/g.42842 Transcript_20578/m.42842 type:complete len:97 (-) Transcript_20578:102-392(-)